MQLLIVLLDGAAVVALALMLPSGLVDPASALASGTLALVALCGVYVGEVGMGIVFLLGFRLLYSGRGEYGLRHGQSLDRSALFLVVFVAIAGVSIVYSAANGLVSPGIGGVPEFYLLTGNLVSAPAGALFAGLAMTYGVRALHPEGSAGRLRTATILGVLGAAAGPLVVFLVVNAGLTSAADFASGLIASAVVGEGLPARSVFLFISEYREVRRNLEAGEPSPVLPRTELVYPPPYQPVYPPPPPKS